MGFRPDKLVKGEKVQSLAQTNKNLKKNIAVYLFHHKRLAIIVKKLVCLKSEYVYLLFYLHKLKNLTHLKVSIKKTPSSSVLKTSINP